MKQNPKCPKCKSTNTAFIVYGETRDFDFESSGLDRKISFGGCCIGDDSPIWKCLDCKHLWGKIFPKKFDPKTYKRKNLEIKQGLQKNRTKHSKKQDNFPAETNSRQSMKSYPEFLEILKDLARDIPSKKFRKDAESRKN